MFNVTICREEEKQTKQQTHDNNPQRNTEQN